MRRGRERYDIFCSPCHGLTGEGDGMVVQRGYRRPPSFQVDRLRQAPPGHMFDVITNGFGAMPDYAAQVRVRDRWAIAAYMRALQLSQGAAVAELSPEVPGTAAMRPQSKLREVGDELVPELKDVQSKLMMAGAAGAVVCAIGLFMNPAQFVRSFLPAYMWVLAITLGSLGLAMVHQVSGGAWGVVIRRILGAATRTLPLLTILFIPIALGLRSLYPWADAAHVANDPILQWKQPYLNVPFFLARAAIYFALWNAVAFYLNKWSVEQDAPAIQQCRGRCRSSAPAACSRTV